MVIFEILMLNKVWKRRYDKLSYKDREKIYMFFFLVESGILWTLTCWKIIGG